MSDPGSLLVIAGTPGKPPIALRRALDLASRSGATVHLVALVWEAALDRKGLVDEERRRMAKAEVLRQARADLAALVEREAGNGIPVTTQVAWAKDRAAWVARRLAQHPAAMVVKAADEGRGGKHRSQADWALLREVPAPVLLAVDARWPKRPVVLAAVDLSSDGRNQQRLNARVVQSASYMARLYDGDVHLVYTIEVSPVLADLDIIHRDEVERAAKKAAKPLLDALCKEYGISRKHVHMPVGTPRDGINSVADRIKSRLLVLGTSARKGVKGLVIGNTAEKVLERTNTDILALKAD